MLTSTKNPQIIHLRKLQKSVRLRKQERVFIAEGFRLVEEAIKVKWLPSLLIYTADLPERGMEIVRSYESLGVKASPVTSHVMQAASDTQTPQGILALLPMPAPSIPSRLDFTLILDGLRDPGNMGTIFRTALAAGVDAIILPPGTVDPFSPKVVRAAMGAHFNLPLLTLDWDGVSALMESKHLSCFLADPTEGQPYDKTDFSPPLALIIGGEATGTGPEVQAFAPQRVHIPMVGPVESLNAAVAASVLLIEVTRQNRGLTPGAS